MNRLIAGAAVAYAGIGVVSFLRPALVPELFGGTAPTAESRTEVRAVYGGLPLAIAGTLTIAPSSAAAMGVLSAGMAAGRAVSSVIEDQPPGTMTKLWFGIEAALAGALLVGAHSRSKGAAYPEPAADLGSAHRSACP